MHFNGLDAIKPDTAFWLVPGTCACVSSIYLNIYGIAMRARYQYIHAYVCICVREIDFIRSIRNAICTVYR